MGRQGLRRLDSRRAREPCGAWREVRFCPRRGEEVPHFYFYHGLRRGFGRRAKRVRRYAGTFWGTPRDGDCASRRSKIPIRKFGVWGTRGKFNVKGRTL